MRSPSPAVDRLVDAFARDLEAILWLEAENSIRSVLREPVREVFAPEPTTPILVLDLGDITIDGPGPRLVRVVRRTRPKESGDRPLR